MLRSYSSHSPVQIIRYANRLEIRNSGFSLKSPERPAGFTTGKFDEALVRPLLNSLPSSLAAILGALGKRHYRGEIRRLIVAYAGRKPGVQRNFRSSCAAIQKSCARPTCAL